MILGSRDANWGEIGSKCPRFVHVINHLKQPQLPVAKMARYDFKSVVALIRAIRNLSQHLHEKPQEVQDVFGGSAPKTLVSDLFLQIYPQLLISTWMVACKEVGNKAGFNEYYHEWWLNNA